MKTPSGFVATCVCGNAIGALDADRTDRADMGKILGGWLMRGCTVSPQFGYNWAVTLNPCACPKAPPAVQPSADCAGQYERGP